MRRALFVASTALALALCQGCLVLSLHPVYDDEWIAWDPGLLGQWRDVDDNSSLRVETAEWRSYRVHYEHPSEKGDLTGYLTVIGDAHYLDLAPLRGEDRGSFVLPVHMVLRLALDGDQLTLTPLSYDVLSERLHADHPAAPGLAAVLDQKQNVLITSPTARLRAWLRDLPPDSPVWGAAATFTRQH